jgi:hypothetical protein
MSVWIVALDFATPLLRYDGELIVQIVALQVFSRAFAGDGTKHLGKVFGI